MNILGIDLGTSAVKAVIWQPDNGVLARGSAAVETTHPQPGFDEQDADAWWSGVQEAIANLPLDDLSAVGLSSQRETFVCLDAHAQPLRAAILWSDGRAPSPAARFAWLQQHEPDVARRTRWLAAPKDVVLLRLVGQLVTDTTLASRTDVEAALLPTVVEPRATVGEFHGARVVAGAGDRACEVLAVQATAVRPMVSWGTTANCSLPLDGAVPAGWRASTHVDGRQLAEAGLSAAGAAIGWLGRLVGAAPGELATLAAETPRGANGVIALPWLNGARAPWWRPDARATFLGVTSATTPGELARAVYEGVAHDVRRALEQLAVAPEALTIVGGGASDACWQQALGGITGLPLSLMHDGDAAVIGAAELALPEGVQIPPVAAGRLQPDPAAVDRYAELSRLHDAAATAVLGSLM